MEEARRFLRYVIPGLIFFIEVSLYLILSAEIEFIAQVKSLHDNFDLGVPVSIFLTSGGLGFLFATLYHASYYTRLWGSPPASHVPVVRTCLQLRWLRLRHPSSPCSDYDPDSLSELGGWRVVTAYWHERTESSDRIKAAIKRTDPLSDLLHSLGATLVGSFFAIITWFCLHCRLVHYCFWPPWWTYLMPVSILLLQFANYLRVAESFRTLVEMVMAEDLNENHATLIVPHFELIQKSKRWNTIRPVFLVFLVILSIIGLAILLPSIMSSFSGNVVAISDGDMTTVMHQGWGEKV